MFMSSRFDRALLPLSVAAGLLVGFASGCARSTSTNETEPEIAVPEVALRVEPAEGEILKRDRESIANALQGRTSGVRVAVNPNGTITVRIRGATSFYGSDEPLYVLDGVPLMSGHGGTLAGVNPYDIESIKVLKGPPETTLYGVRGANGVVLIKTKRP